MRHGKDGECRGLTPSRRTSSWRCRRRRRRRRRRSRCASSWRARFILHFLVNEKNPTKTALANGVAKKIFHCQATSGGVLIENLIIYVSIWPLTLQCPPLRVRCHSIKKWPGHSNLHDLKHLENSELFRTLQLLDISQSKPPRLFSSSPVFSGELNGPNGKMILPKPVEMP